MSAVPSLPDASSPGWLPAEFAPRFGHMIDVIRAVDAAEIAAARYVTTPYDYERARLDRAEDLELALLRWPAGTTTPLHGHGESAALLVVRSGWLVDDQFVPTPDGIVYRRVAHGPSAISFMPPGSFHRVQTLEAAFGIHVYAPFPLDPSAPIGPEDRELLREAWREAHRGAAMSTLPDWL